MFVFEFKMVIFIVNFWDSLEFILFFVVFLMDCVVGYLKFFMVCIVFFFVGLVFDVFKWVFWFGWGLGRGVWEVIWKVWEKYGSNNVLIMCFFYLGKFKFYNYFSY